MKTTVVPVAGQNAAADWWKKAVFYQIYPRSFADANGDGIGDIAGIVEHLDYLQELGVDGLWISPFYPSPQYDHGYDVANYLDINPEYGTLEEFKKLVELAHQRGIRIVIDVVPNHSSSEHIWFKEALAAEPGSPERDRYMFRYQPEGAPNNWGSMFGGPAWSKVEDFSGKDSDSGWWFLHMFDSHQPDFNWENDEVKLMFDDYLRFWCDLGVDGFRVDVAHGLVKADGLPDDEIGPERFSFQTESGDTQKAPNIGPYYDQEGVHDVYRRWRQVLNEYGPDRMLVAEAWVQDPDRLARYVRPDEMSQAFNFDILMSGWNAAEVSKILRLTSAANANVGAVNTWVMSNHDVVRHSSRLGYPQGSYTGNGIGPTDPRPDQKIGLQRALAMTTFLMGLPGSMYIYNGEELGLPEVQDIPDEERVDPTWKRTGKRAWGRDGCRVPLPWIADAPNAGFGSSGKPWLTQPKDWGNFAVDQQEKDPQSVLHYYRKLIALRRELCLGDGQLDIVSAPDSDLLMVKNGDLLVCLNLGITALPIGTKNLADVKIASPESEGESAIVDKEGILYLAPNSAVWVVA